MYGSVPAKGVNRREKTGFRRAREAGRDARLDDRVTPLHAATIERQARRVQRMGERPHKARGGIARQLGVGIERDDELDALERRPVADAQKGIDFRPAFAP